MGIGIVDALSGSHALAADQATSFASAEAAATKALSLAPDFAWAHLCMGLVQIFTNRATEGIAEMERALALDRNIASAHGHIGYAKIVLGRSEEAEAHILEALRLSPQDPFAYLWMTHAGTANLYLGRDKPAVAWLRRCIELNRNYPIAQLCLGAAYAQLGKLDEARAAARAGLTNDPTFTIRRFRSSAASDYPNYLAGRERAIEGMRKAGVPEE